MFKLKKSHKYILGSIVLILLLLSAVYTYLYGPGNLVLTIILISLSIFFFPLGLIGWLPNEFYIPFWGFIAYYLAVISLIYNIKKSEHRVRFIIILLILLLVTFIGCAVQGGPNAFIGETHF